MSGFFGVVSKQDCVCDVFYGTDYHSHLGTKRGGLAFSDAGGTISRRIHDITNSQFRSKFDAEMANFHGTVGFGVISDTDDQPQLITGRFGSFAIVTVGRINNMREIVENSFNSGNTHFSQGGNGEFNVTEVTAMLICCKTTILEGIQHAQRVIDGSCSMLVMHEGRLYAARDRYGRTPVLLGKKEGAMAVTMESTAFPNLDYELAAELGPGEIVELSADGWKVLQEPGKTMKMCTFFWVYYGFPSSCYEGVNTESARYLNGESMAEDDRGRIDEIDSVCGIPDSGVAHAIGYSNAAGKPYRRAFVKYTPTWPRSFMPQNQKMRDLVAKMKLIPVRKQIEGKRLMFCDDSIVRGTQMKDTVVRLYECGAKEVHMRSACPPLLYGCRFLNFSSSRSQMDLAARRAIAKLEGVQEPTEEMIRPYLEYGSPKYEAMVKEVCKALHLSSLRFQNLPKLLKAIGVPPEKLCTYCWNGRDVENEAPALDIDHDR